MNRLARLSLNNRSFIALVCIAVSIIGAFIMTTMRQEGCHVPPPYGGGAAQIGRAHV